MEKKQKIKVFTAVAAIGSAGVLWASGDILGAISTIGSVIQSLFGGTG